ncbi:MAG: hypothetical protein CMJ78_16160 [Planctomycetaceae bacterium]|nr:hypothetical protein [Planctomycetaceae bacterium]
MLGHHCLDSTSCHSSGRARQHLDANRDCGLSQNLPRSSVGTRIRSLGDFRYKDSESQAGSSRHFWCSAGVFIDATYEGDLLATAGADYRLGRESRDEFNEAHAGVVYFDYQNAEFLPGTTGEADSRLPAYTYRLCLTTDPANAHVLTEPPSDYCRETYTGYFDDLAAGRLSGPKHLKPGRGYNAAHFDTMFRAFSVTEIPNGKTDVKIISNTISIGVCA